MTETGCIVQIDDSYATVSIPMKGACKSCGLCATGEGGRDVTIQALNRIGAKVGEIVEVEIVGRRMLAAAFVVYMFPVLATIGGFLVGRSISAGNEESNLPIILAVVFLVASFLGVWLYDLRVRKTDRMSATVMRVVPADEAAGGR